MYHDIQLPDIASDEAQNRINQKLREELIRLTSEIRKQRSELNTLKQIVNSRVSAEVIR